MARKNDHQNEKYYSNNLSLTTNQNGSRCSRNRQGFTWRYDLRSIYVC